MCKFPKVLGPSLTKYAGRRYFAVLMLEQVIEILLSSPCHLTPTFGSMGNSTITMEIQTESVGTSRLYSTCGRVI